MLTKTIKNATRNDMCKKQVSSRARETLPFFEHLHFVYTKHYFFALAWSRPCRRGPVGACPRSHFAEQKHGARKKMRPVHTKHTLFLGHENSQSPLSLIKREGIASNNVSRRESGLCEPRSAPPAAAHYGVDIDPTRARAPFLAILVGGPIPPET